MVGGGLTREAQLLAEDVIVVVQNRDVAISQVTVGSHHGSAGVEAIEIGARVQQALRQPVQAEPHLANVERGVQVALEHVQIAVLALVAASHLADQEEVQLAEVGGELLDRAAEVAGLLQRDVLQGIDAKAVAVGQRDPVLVAARQVDQEPRRREPEIAQGNEVRPLVLGVGIVDVALAKVATPGSRVPLGILQLRGPDPILARLDRGQRLSLVAEPGAERITPPGVARRRRTARGARRVDPVGPAVIEDDVEDDPQPGLVGRRDEVHQVAPAAEVGVDVQGVLDAIPVIAVQVAALLEHGAQPQRRHAEPFEVRQLGGNPLQCPALPALRARPRPAVPAPRLPVRPLWSGVGQALTVQQAVGPLLPIAKAVHQQEIECFVAPVHRRGMVLLAPRQQHAAHARGPWLTENVLHECHDPIQGPHVCAASATDRAANPPPPASAYGHAAGLSSKMYLAGQGSARGHRAQSAAGGALPGESGCRVSAYVACGSSAEACPASTIT